MQHIGSLWMQLGTHKWRNQTCIHHRSIPHTGNFTFPSKFNDSVKQNWKTRFWKTQKNKRVTKRNKPLTSKICKESWQGWSINMSFCFFSTAVHAAGWIIYINLKSATRKVWNSIGIRCPEDTCGWFWVLFFWVCFLFFVSKSMSSPLRNIVVLIGVVFVSLHIVSVNERFNPLFQVSRLQEKMRLVKQLAI